MFFQGFPASFYSAVGVCLIPNCFGSHLNGTLKHFIGKALATHYVADALTDYVLLPLAQVAVAGNLFKGVVGQPVCCALECDCVEVIPSSTHQVHGCSYGSFLRGARQFSKAWEVLNDFRWRRLHQRRYKCCTHIPAKDCCAGHVGRYVADQSRVCSLRRP